MFVHIIAASVLLATVIPVPAIQGPAHTSPHAGATISTRGIVTTVTPVGFYVQDPSGDGNDATSDGVFVYTASPPAVLLRDDVEIAGTVVEFLPGNDAANLTITEIHPSSVHVVASGRPLPAPVVLGGTGRIPPREIIDDDGFANFDPDTDGIDFWESLEGMRVRLVTPRATGPANDYGEVWVTMEGAATGLSVRGALVASNRDANPERIQIDDTLLPQPMPAFDTGDVLDDVVGVVDYRYGNFEVQPTEAPRLAAHGPGVETTPLSATPGTVTVATFNVENLAPRDAEHMRRVARTIVINLRTPTLIVLQEIQDASGPANDGVTTAVGTLDSLRAAIRASGGPDYAAVDVAPADGEDGGQPGANIRVALLFDRTRASIVTRGVPGPHAASLPAPADSGGVMLTVSPGRVSPGDAAWEDTRKPFAAELRVDGRPLFIVGCHFSSKIGTTPEFGSIQPPIDPRAGKRARQAALVRDFVESIARIDPAARVIVAGDLNDDMFSGALAPLSASPVLYDPLWQLAETERYSYVHDGSAHAYDRILVSVSLMPATIDVVHVGAGGSDAPGDHDPVLARVTTRRQNRPTPRLRIDTVAPNPSSSTVTVRFSADGRVDTQTVIYDALGRAVRRLTITEPGVLAWDGNDDAGHLVASGVYFLRVRRGGEHVTARIVRVTPAR